MSFGSDIASGFAGELLLGCAGVFAAGAVVGAFVMWLVLR